MFGLWLRTSNVLSNFIYESAAMMAVLSFSKE